MSSQIKPLLNEKELAATLGLSVATIQKWRIRGAGPKFKKLGVSVRYDPDDVQAWLTAAPTGGAGRRLEAE